MDYQRQLLKELMNPLIPSAKKDFNDKDVCKSYLAGFCVNELFLNTKVDLGRCNLIHDEKLQKEYQKTVDRIYDEQFYRQLQKMLADVERTIQKGHSRLDNKNDHVFDNIDDIKEKIMILEEQISPKMPEICELGEAGKVAEAMDLYYHIQKMNQELDVVRQSDPSHHTYRADKKMEVCQICGALLANDTARIDSHMIGKQHTGYLKIRRTVEEFGNRLLKLKQRKEAATGVREKPTPYQPYDRRGQSKQYDRYDRNDKRR